MDVFARKQFIASVHVSFQYVGHHKTKKGKAHTSAAT